MRLNVRIDEVATNLKIKHTIILLVKMELKEIWDIYNKTFVQGETKTY